MQLLLGTIIGLLLAILLVLTLVYLRAPIQTALTVAEVTIGNKSPRTKGFIVDAPDDDEDARSEIIARNRAIGKDTHISELR